ncbi:distal membrane-arm assembly complex protein 2 [Ostrinia furnacalis]|uniref:distal membrane-arm assembly complex protein 2 n=1 Tax=Ostrinia furnacalis TaxID=93504 RepID=UPI00103E6B02|nr:distal membrane-arm assembly complex protein 2 [Ostrinia furnacalis]
MALTSKTSILYRALTITSRRYYCDKNEKSIYQRHEEGEKPRMVHGQEYPDWRKPWVKREGEFTSKLSVFVEKNPSPDIMFILSQIPNVTRQKIKDWWSSMKELQEIENQKYIPERVATLGANLAAVHFFCYRYAAVRLKGKTEWIRGNITNLTLPNTFTDGYYVEAIDCSDFHHNGIRYEGLENLTNLNFLRWLSLKNNKHVDVWCLDRIAGLTGKTLEFLDISGCNLCVGGVYALARMSALKMLVITDPGPDIKLQTALSLLEEENPNILIKAIPPSK